MKSYVIYLSLSIFVMTSCNEAKTPDAGQQALLDASRQELVTALEERDQLLALVKEISTSMNRIKQLEHILTVGEAQPKENSRRNAQILADIKSIKATLRQRREELAALEAKLQESSLFTDELSGTIAVLRSQIDTQSAEIESLQKKLSAANQEIESLTSTIDSLNTTVETVNNELIDAVAQSTGLENELNTCYYVIASKSELKRHKIIESGFLRKTKILKGNFDHGFFTVGDKRSLDTIFTTTSELKIHTTHPAQSFRIIDVNGSKALEITDPEQFWNLSNYLVIERE